MLVNFLEARDVIQSDVARGIGMDTGLLSRKLWGQRRLYLEDAQVILAYLRERCDEPDLTLDDLFSDPLMEDRVEMAEAVGASR